MTSALPPRLKGAQPIITIENQIITVNFASQFIVHGHTLTADRPAIKVAGIILFLAPFGTALVVDGVTNALLQPLEGLLTTGSSSNHHTIRFHHRRPDLSPGGSTITGSGTTYSLCPHASAFVINDKTLTLLQIFAGEFDFVTTTIMRNPVIAEPELIIGNQIVVAGQTIITVSKVRVSLLLSDNEIAIGSLIEILPSGFIPILTIRSRVVIVSKPSKYIVSGQTLIPDGAAVIISGVTVSLASEGSDLVIQRSTVDLMSPSATGSVIGVMRCKS